MKQQQKHPVVTKNVKHSFTDVELNEIGANLARAIGELRGVESEFDQVKASYKAKLTEAESRINALSTARVNGFEMRNENCVVVFRPTDKVKDFYLEVDAEKLSKKNHGLVPILTESMTQDDFQYDLLQAEAMFEPREEVNLFQPTENDRGIIVIGQFSGRWFGALRIKVGRHELNERLDSEQKAFKFRPECVTATVKRAEVWLKDHLKDLAKGFTDQLSAIVEAHKERAE